MSSCVISREAQLPCEPWELASFDADLRPADAPEYGGVSLPTIEQISQIQEQARQEGYAMGHAEGRAEGLREAACETARLRDLADRFASAIRQADDAISQQVLDLSLDLARTVLKSALAVRPELVLPIVREAVRYLPGVQQPALLYLHPDDAVLVRARMGDELGKIGWQLAEDPLLEPGSCRVDTPSNQIDATLSTRWQRLAAALGKDSDWLAA